ncbi:recombinase RecT [Azospirillum canadense]|uniref:recombinase RecT n=1 Tax=Azospirillum canadense TaxID=403962 RepID=UPI00222640F8|nr:recombinase RecT [Azospirillum canadense]MCW2242761.1 recombination protein RecT [Azospirillum canadense]
MSTNTGTAVATTRDASPLDRVRQQIDAMGDQFALALPQHIPVDRFKRIVLTAINQNPDLLNADRKSLLGACMKASQDGLYPDGREGALVIFNTKVGTDDKGKAIYGKAVQWMPMVYGIIKKMRNSGELSSIVAHAVYEKDHFEYVLGDDERIDHKPTLADVRGKMIAVYSIAKLKDGTVQREVMTRAEVEKVRSASRAKDSGPWGQWYEEMARKTVVRRLSKYLPMSTEVEQVLRRDDALYAGGDTEAAKIAAPISGTAAGQLSAFASSPLIEHEDAGQTQQVYALVTLDGEVKEFTSSAEWLARFEAALQGAADPAKLWELNNDAAEWAADMTEGGDDTLARLRKAYLTKPETEQGKPEQAGQPDATSAAQGDTAAPAGDEWADEAAELQRIGGTCQTFGQWTAFLDDHADRITALIAANGRAHTAAWREFVQGRTAGFQGKGKK